MPRLKPLALMFALWAACSNAQEQPAVSNEPALSAFESVDPFIGTGGTGFGQGSAFPGATTPFGLVRLSPDTHGGMFDRLPFAHFGGYWYGDNVIEGFSHLHLQGTGAIDYGTVTVMPAIEMSAAKTSYEGYSLPFTHSDEQAEPGYYAVYLREKDIRVELTATAHTGAHRYRYPSGKDAVVIVDLGHALEDVDVQGGFIEFLPEENRFRGWLDQAGGFSGRFGGMRIYFDGAFSRAWKKHGVWTDGVLAPEAISAATAGTPANLGGYFHFPADTEPVEAFIGISLVSMEGAYRNRIDETKDKTFDDVRAEARAKWEAELNRIEVQGGTEEQRTVFYSALYRTFQMPTRYSDVDGAYRTVHGLRQADGFTFYSDMSLWDTYRTFHPLINLIAPAYARDFVRSLAAMAADRGSLPKWPMGVGDGASMVGTPADIVIADSYLKGITDFDVARVFAAMVSTATLGDPYGMRRALPEYLALGYCPAELVSGSVSVTLESMYADFAISQLATALGKEQLAADFKKRASRFETLWDAKSGFFRAKKADGTLASKSFSPTEHAADFVEGTAWQYLWFTPWNSGKLVELFGGRDAFLAKLDEFFRLSQETPAVEAGGIRMPDDYYWHGNEPDIHAAYMYTLAGYPEKAAPILRWILSSKYAATPAGLDGNDDGGTLSSWYVWSAIGLYPLPAETRYLVGSPIFEKATLRLENGKTFTIRAQGVSQDALYVQAATLNGEPLEVPWLAHEDVAAGGELVLQMGSKPSSWGHD